jgi:ubiquinone/menaquinone biosynthesis C-methylase UbiE
MTDEIKHKVQKQFGNHASAYVASTVHAQGYSLRRLPELTNPQPDWNVLDIATGGGHTALTFASAVNYVIATDITLPMLQAARRHSIEQQVSTVSFAQHDAENLPFANETFSCVTCRVAAHHFPDIERFVWEATRVLKIGGVLAVVDNVSSGEPEIGHYYNSFEKLRDPSHNWAYSSDDWATFFFSAGVDVYHQETFYKELDFDSWAARMSVPEADQTRLRAMLLQAPEGVKAWLMPEQIGDRITFKLATSIIIGWKK